MLDTHIQMKIIHAAMAIVGNNWVYFPDCRDLNFKS